MSFGHLPGPFLEELFEREAHLDGSPCWEEEDQAVFDSLNDGEGSRDGFGLDAAVGEQPAGGVHSAPLLPTCHGVEVSRAGVFDLGLGVRVEAVGPQVADGVTTVGAVLFPATVDEGFGAVVRDEGHQLASALEVDDDALTARGNDLEVGFRVGGGVFGFGGDGDLEAGGDVVAHVVEPAGTFHAMVREGRRFTGDGEVGGPGMDLVLGGLDEGGGGHGWSTTVEG